MPAGIITSIVSSPLILPSPLHTLHGFSGIVPSPLHSGQTAKEVYEPKNVFLTCWTCPVPLQEKHSFILLPGSAPFPLHLWQVICFVKVIFSIDSFKTLSNGNSIST